MAREHYVVGLAYWAFWMLLGWGTYAAVMFLKPWRPCPWCGIKSRRWFPLKRGHYNWHGGNWGAVEYCGTCGEPRKDQFV